MLSDPRSWPFRFRSFDPLLLAFTRCQTANPASSSLQLLHLYTLKPAKLALGFALLAEAGCKVKGFLMTRPGVPPSHAPELQNQVLCVRLRGG